MPIERDDAGFLYWGDAWQSPAIGLESSLLSSSIEEIKLRGLSAAFARAPEFVEDNLNCLAELPELRALELWDVKLKDISGIYDLGQLEFLRISGKRPPLDLCRIEHLSHLILEWNKRDAGLKRLDQLRMLHLWRHKVDPSGDSNVQLPRRLRALGVYWSNITHFEDFGVNPRVKTVEIGRCRNLQSLGDLSHTFPNLEKLVITACGKLTSEAAEIALQGHDKIQHAFAGDQLLVSSGNN